MDGIFGDIYRQLSLRCALGGAGEGHSRGVRDICVVGIDRGQYFGIVRYQVQSYIVGSDESRDNPVLKSISWLYVICKCKIIEAPGA